MPQLDITINLIWYFCTVLGIGVLYLNNIYIYIPFFIRYWRFNEFYGLYLKLFLLNNYNLFSITLTSSKYYVINCLILPYGLSAIYHGSIISSYKLDVEDYSNAVSGLKNI